MEKVIAADLPLQLILEHAFSDLESTSDMRELMSEFLKYRLVNSKFSIHVKKLLCREFKDIRVQNQVRFDDRKWILTGLMKSYDLTNHKVAINGNSLKLGEVRSFVKFLATKQDVNINSLEFFPIEDDSFGVPPQDLSKLVENMNEIMEESYKFVNHAFRKYGKLSDLPKSSHYEQIVLTSTFLENSANELLELEESERVLEILEESFGSLTCERLVMVLTDMITANDPNLLSKMKVPVFYPLEILRTMLLKLKPKFLHLKLRSENVDSVDDAYRMDWDEFDVFTNFVLYNSPEFSELLNISLGDELQDIVLILDPKCALTWSQTLNSGGYENIGRDYLSLLPMKRIYFTRILTVDVELTTSSQIMFEIDDLMKIFWKNPNISKNREFFCTIELKRKNNQGEFLISKKLVKKSIPRSFNDRQLRVQYNYKNCESMFEKKSISEFQEIISIFDTTSVIHINLVS